MLQILAKYKIVIVEKGIIGANYRTISILMHFPKPIKIRYIRAFSVILKI